MANATHKDIRRVNDLTRAHAAHFIAALSVGLFGSVPPFCARTFRSSSQAAASSISASTSHASIPPANSLSQA